MNINMQITENAINRIKSLLQEENNSNLKLRISVIDGGCLKLKYNFDLVEQITDNDFVLIKNDLSILINKDSLKFIDGSVLDFIEELDGSYFKIINSKIKKKCNCGNSFLIE